MCCHVPPHPSAWQVRGAGGRQLRPTSVRTGGQLSWTQGPAHSWRRLQPFLHQPQPMKRSARRQRWHVEKWRQPGPVTFRSHTWGWRVKVRGHMELHARPMPLRAPTHLGASSEEQRVALLPHGSSHWPPLSQGEVGQGQEEGAGALQHHLQQGRAGQGAEHTPQPARTCHPTRPPIPPGRCVLPLCPGGPQ